MSKYVKNLLISDVRKKLAGVNDALLVSVSGLDAVKNQSLRAKLRGKGISLMVVKNSLARQATGGSPLNVAFDQAEGSLAVVWGSTDIVNLAKEIVAIAEDRLPRSAKQSGADPDHVGAFLDCYPVIMRHPHGQPAEGFRVSNFFTQLFKNAPHFPENRPGLRGILI